jgi:hypothetical protein
VNDALIDRVNQKDLHKTSKTGHSISSGASSAFGAYWSRGISWLYGHRIRASFAGQVHNPGAFSKESMQRVTRISPCGPPTWKRSVFWVFVYIRTF